MIFRPRRPAVFLATADAAAAPEGSKLNSVFVRQVKLLTLLGYEVVTAAPFLWQGDVLDVGALEPLLDVRALGLATRQGVATAEQYVGERIEDTRNVHTAALPAASRFATEVPSRESLVVARRLDAIAPLLARVRSVETTFASMFLRDIESTAAPQSVAERVTGTLPTRFSEFGRRRAEGLLTELAHLPWRGHFSRAQIDAAMVKLHAPGELRVDVNRRSTGLYHAANAAASDAALFTWRTVAVGMPATVRHAHEFSLSALNPYLFARVLQVFGVSLSAIDLLSAARIGELATEAPEVAAFVHWFKELIAPMEVRENSPSDNSAIEWMATQVTEVHQAMQRHVQRDRWLDGASRAQWLIAALAALVSSKLGYPLLTAGRYAWSARSGVVGTVDYLRKKCDLALHCLRDFDALLIREGLKSIATK